MKWIVAILVVLSLVVTAGVARAHKPSDAYLTLEIDGGRIHGRWDIAIRDLDYALEVADERGKVTWGDLRERRAQIEEYALRKLTIEGCSSTPRPDGYAIASHSDGEYVVLLFDATCERAPTKLDIEYRLFFDIDPQHRGLLRLDVGGRSRTHAFSAREPKATFDLADAGRLRQLLTIGREGVLHIWTGYDHVLFLIALLLPSVLRREEKTWVPVPKLRPALGDILRIVTAFTLAHSITLSLAALGVVTLPSRLVESAIAASIVLAAVNNLYPVLRQDRWVAAFLLGLMHGFGFSAALADLDLPRSNLVITLFGFNLGVEVGQVAIVGIFVPLAYAARRSPLYQRVALRLGSVGILVLATVWLIERALVVKILPGG